MTDNIEYLNQVMTKGKIENGSTPKYLYKYRPFDFWAFDMLEKNYVYLCPAEKLDDETECVTSSDFNDLYDVESDSLKTKLIYQLMEILRPYISEENYQSIKKIVDNCVDGQSIIDSSFLNNILEQFQILVSGKDIVLLKNSLATISDLSTNSNIGDQIKKLLEMGVNARKQIGICSLCESNDIEEMWKLYADNLTGYCVQLDMEYYDSNNPPLPVFYKKERQNNVVMELVASLVKQVIREFSNNEIKTDASNFLRLFLTKFDKWSYQKEWRLIGKAGDKLISPKIKTIWLGNNVEEKNRFKMKSFCKKNDIELKNIHPYHLGIQRISNTN